MQVLARNKPLIGWVRAHLRVVDLGREQQEEDQLSGPLDRERLVFLFGCAEHDDAITQGIVEVGCLLCAHKYT